MNEQPPALEDEIVYIIFFMLLCSLVIVLSR